MSDCLTVINPKYMYLTLQHNRVYGKLSINLNFLPAQSFSTTAAALHVRYSFVTLLVSESVPLQQSQSQSLFLSPPLFFITLFIFVSVAICVISFSLFVFLSLSLSHSLSLGLHCSFLFTFSCYSSFNTKTENHKEDINTS